MNPHPELEHRPTEEFAHDLREIATDLQFEREVLGESVQHDYTTTESGIVPLDRRRPGWHLAAIWLTLEAGFLILFLGFQLYQAGLTFGLTTLYLVLGSLIYIVYALAAAYLGSRSGQTHSLLSRSIFGVSGSGLVSFLIFLGQMGWAGFVANLTAQLFGGLYGWSHILVIGVVLGALMVFNNLFGFTGVATYARYIVTPLLVGWVLYLVIRGVAQGNVIGFVPKVTAPLSAVAAISIVTSLAIWGAEPDFWRYGKPRFWWPALPLAFAFGFGMILFGMGGWIVARTSSSTAFGPAVATVTHLSMFGLFWLAFIVILITQVGLNDGNYYESINALQNLAGGWKRWKRTYSALICAAGGALAAWVIPYEITNGFVKIAAFIAVGVPSATVIMAVDHFLLPRLFGISRPLTRISTWAEAGAVNWPGIIALLIAVTFGAYATGLIPGEAAGTYWGLAPPETWILAGVLYVAGVWIVRMTFSDVRPALGFSKTISKAESEGNVPVDIAAPVPAHVPEAVG
jgi:purine-cytosine permease-like protein